MSGVADSFTSDQSNLMIISPVPMELMSVESVSLVKLVTATAPFPGSDLHDILSRAAGALCDQVSHGRDVSAGTSALAVRDKRDAAQKPAIFQCFNGSKHAQKRAKSVPMRLRFH